MKRTLTTRFCKRCDTETEHYKSGHCKPCVINRRAEYRLENPEIEKEKCRKRKAAWRAENPEKEKQIRADTYARNAENIKAKKRAKYASDPEKYKLIWKNYYSSYSDRHKKAVSKWREKNKDSCRMHDHNRRANKRKNGGVLSKGIIEKLMKLQKGKCACCGKLLGNDYHLDHIFPIKLGGKNIDSNVQLLLSKCNLEKNAKHPVIFMQQRGFLL